MPGRVQAKGLGGVQGHFVRIPTVRKVRYPLKAVALALALSWAGRTFADAPMEPPSAVMTLQLREQTDGFSADVRGTVLALTAKTNFNGPFGAGMLTDLVAALGAIDPNDPEDQALLKSTRAFADGRISDEDFAHSLPDALAGFVDRAVTRLRFEADVGDVNAMCELADLDRIRIGRHANLGDAMQWYTKAANAGSPRAMYKVALMCELGDSAKPDLHLAAGWLQKAADGGFPPAMARLGLFYEYGIGVDRDPAQAMALYHKAADARYVNAFFLIGNLCMTGQEPGGTNAAGYGTVSGGVPGDTGQAIAWFQKGAAAHRK